jgi:hypothetical protein
MPFDNDGSSNGSLAAIAYERVQAAFAGFGHIPSAEQLDAIRDLLDHLELAANNTLPVRHNGQPQAYVSSIPPGTGKSCSIATFTNVLLEDRTRDDCGILILVSRIAEARDMAKQLAAHKARLCVSTSDDAVNTMGDIPKEDIKLAQAVITTQEALRRAVRRAGRDVSKVDCMFYGKVRRRVVVWDETLSFQRPVVFTPRSCLRVAEELLAMAKRPFNKRTRRTAYEVKHDLPVAGLEEQREAHQRVCARWQKDADVLIAWARRMEDITDDYVNVQVPAIRSNLQALEYAVGADEKLVDIVQALRVIEGDSARLMRQGQTLKLITHYSELPRDVLPIVLTDASADLNRAYTHMEETYGIITKLASASKNYEALTIRKVGVPASRSVFKTKPKEAAGLIDLAARYVASVPPDEPVLVISYAGVYQALGRKTIEQAIKAKLSEDDKVGLHVLTYGRHTATNMFRYIEHMLLLGLNFLGDAHYTAAAGAAQGLDLTDDYPESIREFREGSLMDHTLQAILRGHARMGNNGGCGQCEVVVVSSKRHGISDAGWRRMFPNVTLVEDTTLTPKAEELMGKLGALAEHVLRRAGAGETEIRYADIYEHDLSMKQPNFARLLQENRTQWDAWVAANGFTECRLRGSAKGLRKIA